MMRLERDKVLITGGGSGIGRGLAELLLAWGNTVIIAGRDAEKLSDAQRALENLETLRLDVADAESVQASAAWLKAVHPDLRVVVHCAGVSRFERIGEDDVPMAEEMIRTNLLGTIRLNSALLPILKRQPQSTIVTVSSGVAFVPLFFQPTYCATKAAIHSYTQSLRYQLRTTSVRVVELIPPYVQTELTGPRQASDPHAMPLPDFIAEVGEILRRDPNVTEICVERVLRERNAAAEGRYAATYQATNDAVAALV